MTATPATKACKDCGRVLPVTRDYFGQYKNSKKGGAAKIGFRNSCRECMAANTAKHSASNLEQRAERAERRAHQVNRNGGAYSDADIQRIKNLLMNKCRFCGDPLGTTPHIEHLTPVSRGGSSDPRNITLSCGKCNLAKTNKTLSEFLDWRGERGLINRKIIVPGECPDVAVGRAGRTIW